MDKKDFKKLGALKAAKEIKKDIRKKHSKGDIFYLEEYEEKYPENVSNFSNVLSGYFSTNARGLTLYPPGIALDFIHEYVRRLNNVK